MPDFRMPKLGADMTAGKLVAWYKKLGDAVKRGDVIAEVETVKGDIDVEIFADGVIEKLLVPPGETVPVGTVLALIKGEEAQPAQEGDATLAEPGPMPPGLTRRLVEPEPSSGTMPASRVVISPSARNPARELGVEPDLLNSVIALQWEANVEIPEEDYARLATLHDSVNYLAAAKGDRT
jgi:pyruvate dehydrogenase E2 component (dihydrolipoamide acetyltransferase)